MHPALPGVRDIGGDIENEGVYPCCGAKVQWTANDARASGNSEAYTKGCLRVSHAEWQSDLDAHEIEISLEVAQLVAQHANIQPIGLFPLVDSPNVLVIRRSDQLDQVYEEMEPRQEPV